MRPVSAHHLQIAFKTAGRQDDETGAEFLLLAAAHMDSSHPHDAPGLDDQSGGLRTPNKKQIIVSQTLTVNRADQAHPASRGNVLPTDTVSRNYLRIQLPTSDAQVLQPIVNFTARILCVELNPAGVGVFAEPDKVLARQFHR